VSPATPSASSGEKTIDWQVKEACSTMATAELILVTPGPGPTGLPVTITMFVVVESNCILNVLLMAEPGGNGVNGLTKK
jgi:hypothetical protein